jgi:hypothetical protein
MSGMSKNVLANLAAAVAALCAGTSVVVTRVAVGEIDPDCARLLSLCRRSSVPCAALAFRLAQGSSPCCRYHQDRAIGRRIFWIFSLGLQRGSAVHVGGARRDRHSDDPDPDLDRCRAVRPRADDEPQDFQRRACVYWYRRRVRSRGLRRRGVQLPDG